MFEYENHVPTMFEIQHHMAMVPKATGSCEIKSTWIHTDVNWGTAKPALMLEGWSAVVEYSQVAGFVA